MCAIIGSSGDVSINRLGAEKPASIRVFQRWPTCSHVMTLWNWAICSEERRATSCRNM